MTLVETGHFTKAADRLYMTQPGVSQHIQKLELACGHALIERENKGFELTEQGRLVFQYAQQLEISERVLHEQLMFDDPFAGSCSIACSGALALVLYPKLIALQKQHKELIIHLKAAPNAQILNDIESGLIDVGLVTHIPNPLSFSVEEIGQEELCLVLPNSFENSQLNAQDLLDLGLINHPDAEHYLSLLFAKNAGLGLSELSFSELNITGSVNQINQILLAVAGEVGFTVLPKSAVDSFHLPQQLTIFRSGNQVMETLYRVTKKKRNLPARFKAVNTLLNQHFEMDR